MNTRNIIITVAILIILASIALFGYGLAISNNSGHHTVSVSPTLSNNTAASHLSCNQTVYIVSKLQESAEEAGFDKRLTVEQAITMTHILANIIGDMGDGTTATKLTEDYRFAGDYVQELTQRYNQCTK